MMGTPFWLFSLPICLAAHLTRPKERVFMFPPQGSDPREWTAMEWCFDCQDDIEHTFLQFMDDGSVESECSMCKVLRVREESA